MAAARRPAEILILELAAGRWSGGHHSDYLEALLEVLADRHPRLFAPYLKGRKKRNRMAQTFHDLWMVWRSFTSAPPQGRIVIAQAPSPWELLFCRLVTLGRRRSVVALFVLRRTDRESTGVAAAKDWLTGRVTDSLIHGRRVWPASDSTPALDSLRRRTGVQGSSLDLPGTRALIEEPRRDGPLSVGLLGAFRLEKGARYYDTAIRAALDSLPDVSLDVQTEVQHPDGSAEIGSQLRKAWLDHPQVRLHDGYLPSESYAHLLGGCDIIILPYVVNEYGTGTSGVLHEAVTMGCTVLATPIVWARQEYGHHPHVVFLEGTDQKAFTAGLREAASRAMRHRTAARVQNQEGIFATSWQDALAAAEALLPTSDRDARPGNPRSR